MWSSITNFTSPSQTLLFICVCPLGDPHELCGKQKPMWQTANLRCSFVGKFPDSKAFNVRTTRRGWTMFSKHCLLKSALISEWKALTMVLTRGLSLEFRAISENNQKLLINRRQLPKFILIDLPFSLLNCSRSSVMSCVRLPQIARGVLTLIGRLPMEASKLEVLMMSNFTILHHQWVCPSFFT